MYLVSEPYKKVILFLFSTTMLLVWFISIIMIFAERDCSIRYTICDNHCTKKGLPFSVDSETHLRSMFLISVVSLHPFCRLTMLCKNFIERKNIFILKIILKLFSHLTFFFSSTSTLYSYIPFCFFVMYYNFIK